MIKDLRFFLCAYNFCANFFFRDDHPKNIFESMETIMTVVLEESEDVSVELLMPILAILKRGNEVSNYLNAC